jgi:hypothetical protein
MEKYRVMLVPDKRAALEQPFSACATAIPRPPRKGLIHRAEAAVHRRRTGAAARALPAAATLKEGN